MSSKIDQEFMEVLSSTVDAEGDINYSDDGWMPPDGEYTCLLTEFSTLTKKKGDVNNAIAKPTFQIVDGEHEGRTFTDFCWIPPNLDKVSPGQTQLLRLGTCILGRSLAKGEIHEAAKAIEEAAGDTAVNLRVFRTVSKSNGKTYENIRYLGRVDEPSEASIDASAMS